MTTLGKKLVRNKFRDVVCGECQRTFVTKEPRKLFCDPCGIGRRNKRVVREINLRGPARWACLQKIADEKAAKTPWLHDVFSSPPQFLWAVTIAVPFSLDVSKNRRWSNNGRGVVFLSDGVRAYQQMLITDLTEALADRDIKQAKVWLSLHVQKPNHRSDAVNAIDTICDALKKAIGVDDNWFCIDRVDWSVQKKDPMIFIRVAQESACDMVVCSHCGEISPADTHSINRRSRVGRSRVCRTCCGAIDAEMRALRAKPAA